MVEKVVGRETISLIKGREPDTVWPRRPMFSRKKYK